MSNLTLQIKEPTIVTLLTTFKCTAKCRNCCFQCSPQASRMMSLAEMKSWLDECFETFPSIRLVVFTGGECTLLGEDLVEAIKYVASKRKLTRIVTNGWWAKSYEIARKYIIKLKEAGLNEINFSSGDDHQEWVPFLQVRDAAVAALQCGIKCAINIETHDHSKFNLNDYFEKDEEFASLCSDGCEKKHRIFIENGIWASMGKSSAKKITYESYKSKLDYKGCANLFNNIPINPYGEVLSCCGITSEVNPYLRIGNIKKEFLLFMNDLLLIY